MYRVLFLLVGVSFSAMAQQGVKDYERLKLALLNNHPPSGFIRLEKCTLQQEKGRSFYRSWAFSISFKDQFEINNHSDEITSSSTRDILRKEKSELVVRKLYASLNASANRDWAEYRILVTDLAGEVLVSSIYQCSWKKAISLWRD